MTVSPESRVQISTNASAPQQWRYFAERPFRGEDRTRTTVLFGGLTEKHEKIVRGAPELKRPSYRVPQSPETVGAAANFVYHVRRLMDGASHGP
jgi:hypothetical protein